MFRKYTKDIPKLRHGDDYTTIVVRSCMKPSEKFSCNADNGRFIVKSFRTGRTYVVEAIGDPHTVWGDMNPSTKKLTGNYGDKYKGSIKEEESLITSENGFYNISTLQPGQSPFDAIDKIDEQYPSI
jgi:hypothetical protein